jgi:hypothetical protein
LVAGAGISGATDKAKKSVSSGESPAISQTPATTQNQNFFPNNPEEKKGQSL